MRAWLSSWAWRQPQQLPVAGKANGAASAVVRAGELHTGRILADGLRGLVGIVLRAEQSSEAPAMAEQAISSSIAAAAAAAAAAVVVVVVVVVV